MSWEPDLRARLSAATPVREIVGDNISWFEMPRRGGLPCLTLTIVWPGEEYTHSGPSPLVNPRVQFDAWSDDDAIVLALRDAVKAEMQRIDDVIVGGTIFQAPGLLELSQPSADMIGGSDASPGLKVYRWQQDFSFFCKPAA